MNEEQTILIAASEQDGIYINLETENEVDIDEQYCVDQLKEVIFDSEEGTFYILANKHLEKLGFYMLRMH